MSRALGIDIGTVSIKVAEIDFTPKGQEIIGLYELARTHDSNEATLIDNFIRSTHVSTARVAIGIGNTNSIIRKMQFPFKDAKRLRLAVMSELEDQLPLSLDDFVIDIRPLGKLGNVYEFLVGVVPKEQVEKINALMNQIGIQPAAYLDDTQALAELALGQKLPAAETDEPYALCDVGLTHSRISIIKGRNIHSLYKEKGLDPFPGEVLELRRIERGSNEWIQYISERRKVSLEESKSWLIHRAEIQTSANDLKSIKQDLSDDVKSALRPWVVELYQTFQASRVQSGVVPKTLYLTGGMVQIAGLKEFLAHELRLSVSSWPIAIGFGTERYAPSESDNRGFASALALASYFCRNDRKNWLNFKRTTNPNRKVLSETYAKFLAPQNRRPVLHLAGLFLAVIVYGQISAKLLGSRLEESRTQLLAELRKADPMMGDSAKRSGILDSRSKTKELVGKIVSSRRRKAEQGPAPTGRASSEVLLDLTRLQPKGSTLKSMLYKDLDSVSSVSASLSNVNDQTEKTRIGKALQSKGYSKINTDVKSGDLSISANWTSRKSSGGSKK